jgi:aromatic ring-cleaving dioxygenase
MKQLSPFHANIYYDKTKKVNGAIVKRFYIRLTNQYRIYLNKRGLQLLGIEFRWR